jgi:diguanylate cyclase (GGDEF)-like protein
MRDSTTDTWGKNELFELLALMMIGTCVWFVGVGFGVFENVTRYAVEHNLMNLVMLSSCMGMGAVAGTIRKSILLRRAILERMAAEALAEATARHDALTGLANRRLFHERLEAALAARKPDESFAVMLIDLDRFKPVNDIHGHAAGNAVLCTVADRLREISPRGSTVARLGGDEFIVLLPSVLNQDALIDLAQQMIAAVRKPVPWNQGRIEVDSTIGIALAKTDNQEPDALLHAADVALYQGKREGRGTFRFFHANMALALEARAQLEVDLRAAIAGGAITPYYQPIVSLPEQDLVGFEVLARWEDRRQNPIAPDVFIPIAEETGVISDLFAIILRKACTDARSWPPNLRLAVNVSPYQLKDQSLPKIVLSILTETGFTPGRLEIEITESALIDDLESARVALMSLQNLGVTIALDDFGTGYSSLYHLRELKFNKLKIDRSFVTALEQGSERAKLVDAIIQLGSSLSLQTTAEGIETNVNLDWLSDQGCSFAQGYLFGHPMPKEAADLFLDAKEANELLKSRQRLPAPVDLRARDCESAPIWDPHLEMMQETDLAG